MASKRAVQLLTLRTNASVAGRQAPRLCAHASRALSTASRAQITNALPSRAIVRESAAISQIGGVQKRWDSSSAGEQKTKSYEYEDVLAILENPSDSRLLIDVREPHEFEANSIPTALNIPVASQPDALLLSEEDFADRFGFAKPPLAKEVVFFCKAGVRSRAAASFAKQAGYTNVGEYKGSWADWEKRGGPGTKSPPPAGGVGEGKGPVTETKVTGRTGTSGEEDVGERGIPEAPKIK
ncbi:hypothetical protein NX059_002948 [Plenodomus lindquistii]|nr:hypothetical protein NX059_002948 [Plenodomus lindquistii]